MIPSENRLQRSVHNAHAAERLAVSTALGGSAATRHQKRSARMADCGSHGRLYMEGDPPTVRLWIHRCGDRLCPLCSHYRSQRIMRQLSDLLLRIKHIRHMTLTLRTFSGGSLAEAMIHLRESFRRLRRHWSWREHVNAAAYVVEVTYNRKANRWHPHIHVLYDGTYYPQRLLSGVWADCTGGSPNVWITPATSKHARYLAKYAGKPADLFGWPAAAILEYADATHGMRMVQTLGSWHNRPLEDKDVRADPPTVRHMLPLSRLRVLAEQGNAAARAMLHAAACRWPCLRIYATDIVALPPPGDRKGPTYDQLQQAADHAAKFCIVYAGHCEIKSPVMDQANNMRTSGATVNVRKAGKLRPQPTLAMPGLTSFSG